MGDPNVYLDANVFLYSALYQDARAARATQILRDVVNGETEGVTACLSLDEILWKLLRSTNRRDALAQARRLLALPHLRILDVTADHVRAALALMERYPRLKPRDATHAAVALAAGQREIVSDDADFDAIAEVKRIPLD